MVEQKKNDSNDNESQDESLKQLENVAGESVNNDDDRNENEEQDDLDLTVGNKKGEELETKTTACAASSSRRNSNIGGAALIGGVTGMIIGPSGALVGAGASAIVAKKCKGRAGDFMRSNGAAAEATSKRVLLVVGTKLRNVERKHHIVGKVQSASTRGVKATFCKLDDKLKVSTRLRNADKKHRFTERSSQAMSSMSNRCVNSVMHSFGIV